MNSKFLVWDGAYRDGFCVVTKLQGFKEQWLLAKGVSVAAKWAENVTLSMSPRYPKDIKLSDNLFGSSARVVSGRVKDALLSLVPGKQVEFLPVSILNHKGRVASGDYFILNPLDIIDCIDQEKSGVVWNAIDSTMISNVENLILRGGVIPKTAVIFRPKYMERIILVRDEVASKLSEPDFTGVSFVDSSGYAG